MLQPEAPEMCFYGLRVCLRAMSIVSGCEAFISVMIFYPTAFSVPWHGVVK